MFRSRERCGILAWMISHVGVQTPSLKKLSLDIDTDCRYYSTKINR